jgi:hypothetical protein
MHSHHPVLTALEFEKLVSGNGVSPWHELEVRIIGVNAGMNRQQRFLKKVFCNEAVCGQAVEIAEEGAAQLDRKSVV